MNKYKFVKSLNRFKFDSIKPIIYFNMKIDYIYIVL